jgi:hypothetical protein
MNLNIVEYATIPGRLIFSGGAAVAVLTSAMNHIPVVSICVAAVSLF